MKRVKFNKKLLFIFIFILGIGTTLAYFTSTVTIPNIFTSLKYETTTTEEFTSPNDWKPGDTTPKTVITTNNSNLPIRVRISVEESWVDKNNNNLSLEENNTLAAILNLDNRIDWIYEDGFYYYKYDLPPGESTSSFIKSVTFNKDIVGEYTCKTENNIEQCDSASDTYQAATYKLNIKVETTPADNYMDAWGLEHTPRRVNPTYCTFDGELVQGAEYINGQYTYHYMQKKSVGVKWIDMEEEGWGVELTDKSLTDPVTTPLCTYINNKPVISTSYMFNNSKTTSIDTSSFDTSNVTDMNHMFMNTINLQSLDISNFETGNTKNMSYMFNTNPVESIDLSTFETKNVTNMGFMFAESNIKNLDLKHFNTEKVTNMSYMFNNSKAESINTSNFNTSNVENMNSMFKGCNNLTELDVSSFDVKKVKVMTNMFDGCTKLEEIDTSNFETLAVTNLKEMFNNCQKIQYLDVSKFNTSQVTSINSTFRNCYLLETIDGLENWQFEELTNMERLFQDCMKLTDISGIENWNISGVTSLFAVFYRTNISNFEPIKNWDISNITNLNSTFLGTKMTSLKVFENWNVSNVLSLRATFNGCKNITNLEGLENWDVRKATSFGDGTYGGMFQGCSNLTDASAINDWDFASCNRLFYTFKSVPVHPTFTKYQGTWNNGSFTKS